ncbi:MAG: DUF2399 domain-containing protein [Solirubrobacteraceae bacterium]
MTGFADPALERLWRVAHASRERRGAAGDARITLPKITAEEAFALDGLPWPGRTRTVLTGATFKTTLSRLEAAVAAAGGDLDAILTAAVGTAPRDLPAESRAQRERRIAFGAWLAHHPVVRAHPRLGEWAAHVRRVGSPGPADRALVATALEVIAALPRSPPVARSTLAAQLLDGDAHALDPDTALGRLAATLLSWRAGNADRRLDPIQTRELWLGHGVEVDPLSCTVLTLGLAPAGETPLPRALRALRGQAVVLTYGQLRGQPLRWPAGAMIFTCENPVVVRAAELALGTSCPPLICTGGWLNAAVLTLLDDLHAAGATIHHHGDEDQAGLKILEYLTERVRATPWRLEAPAEPEARNGQHGDPRPFSLPEELVLGPLLEDLRRGG